MGSGGSTPTTTALPPTTTSPTTPTTVSTPPPTTTAVLSTAQPTTIGEVATTPDSVIQSTSIQLLSSKSVTSSTTPRLITHDLTSPISARCLFSPTPQPSTNPAYILPIAIILSSTFLIVSLTLLGLLYRRKRKLAKPDHDSGGPATATARVYSNTAFGLNESSDCMKNHIYTENTVEGNVNGNDGLYTNIPHEITGNANGHAPSLIENGTGVRGKPDGKSTSLDIKGIPHNVFGEDEYSILFEEKSRSPITVLTQQHEKALPNDHYQNYPIARDSPTMIHELEEESIKTESTDIVKDSISIDVIEAEKDTEGITPTISPNLFANPKNIGGDVLYENTTPDEDESAKSSTQAESAYYEPDNTKVMFCTESGMVDNILYQSMSP